jgi:hypothetical protein
MMEEGGVPSQMSVYEGLKKKKFPLTEEQLLLTRIRREWKKVPLDESQPLPPQRYPYPRSLLVRSEAHGVFTYHVLPVWLMMMPTWMHYIPWISAFWAGFVWLGFLETKQLSYALQADQVPDNRIFWAAKAIEVMTIPMFIVCVFISLWIKSSLEALDKYRATEFLTDGLDHLRRVSITFLIEMRNWIRALIAIFSIAITAWLTAMLLEAWIQISLSFASAGSRTATGGLVAWIVAAGIVGLLWLACFAVNWFLLRKGTYLLSMDRQVLMHH